MSVFYSNRYFSVLYFIIVINKMKISGTAPCRQLWRTKRAFGGAIRRRTRRVGCAATFTDPVPKTTNHWAPGGAACSLLQNLKTSFRTTFSYDNRESVGVARRLLVHNSFPAEIAAQIAMRARNQPRYPYVFHKTEYQPTHDSLLHCLKIVFTCIYFNTFQGIFKARKCWFLNWT